MTIVVIGTLRFPPDRMQTVRPHLLAPHIGPWRKVCKEQGLLARQFTAYEAHNPRSV